MAVAVVVVAADVAAAVASVASAAAAGRRRQGMEARVERIGGKAQGSGSGDWVGASCAGDWARVSPSGSHFIWSDRPASESRAPEHVSPPSLTCRLNRLVHQKMM
jgi:hypothetical protein